MAEFALTAATGRTEGTRSSRRLRREGQVPGIVYGLGNDPVTLSVDYSELRAVLTTDAGMNALINLEVAGDTQLCIVKDIQRDPVRNEVLHVDFIRIDPDIEIAVDVPIHVVGEARKVTEENGMVDHVLFTLHVLSKPDAIPNELVVDISDLTVGDSIRVGDIELPAGVRTEVDPEESVAIGTVTRSTLESIAEDEAAEAEAEAEEAAEGGEAADGGAESSDADAE